ncbi:hypothetical protein CEXT_7111 [Caerostris extrusa]|uniref:Uncharacterized protein n=1 Tax=Caerostris extrusa TaxID=172846 RepID=A0AAV4RE74_CAEEX|nr:hypothetical protein CEXT_7111 [Caerostris extrusa]
MHTASGSDSMHSFPMAIVLPRTSHSIGFQPDYFVADNWIMYPEGCMISVRHFASHFLFSPSWQMDGIPLQVNILQ